jgi:S-adenosylmethionine synthetase
MSRDFLFTSESVTEGRPDGTEHPDLTPEAIEKAVCSTSRLSAIITTLDLRRPIYQATAAYGHFGRADHDIAWERVDRVDDLLAAVSG